MGHKLFQRQYIHSNIRNHTYNGDTRENNVQIENESNNALKEIETMA